MSIRWAHVTKAGLYCQPADAFIDPSIASPLAIITHGHADHARAGHGHVIATPQTADIMQARYGAGFAKQVTVLEYGQTLKLGEAELSFVPAGHVLGSAQAVLAFQGQKLVAAGDYKRKTDPTCAPFEVVQCDVFVTEATFGLPVFRHPDPVAEINRLLAVHRLFPERTMLVGAYALGKAQRIMALLREAGYNQPVYLHGAMQKLTELYEKWGVSLGAWQPATANISLAGKIVIAPPSAFGTSWMRRLNDPLICFASGWMQVRQRAKQRGVELPLILSDHADWDDLLATIDQIAPKEVWVTHGREEALIHACEKRGISAKALSLMGYDEAET